MDASGHAGVRLKKVGGDWKVDLRAAEALLPPGGAAELDKEREQFAATKKGFNETTAKILDGAYTDCQSALDGVKAAIGAQP